MNYIKEVCINNIYKEKKIMKNEKKLNYIGELKAQLNTPKTETRIILNDWQSESKSSKLSLAARNKVVNNSSYVSSRTTDLVPSYGPCSTCGVSDKTFFINMDLRNAAGKHLSGSASNTKEAMNQAAAILRGDGGWEGTSETGCFKRANREDLVKEINRVVAQHIKGDGEAVTEQLHNVPS